MAVSAGHEVTDVISAPNEYSGFTPLHAAAMLADVTIVETLLGHNADVNKKTSNGDTALYEACFEGEEPR